MNFKFYNFILIAEIDAHSDTPVEVLHVVLLGFVKYFWRDAVSRLNDAQKHILVARISSCNISGLDPSLRCLSGKTLVQYARSLTGRDFRLIAQVAPFTLYDLVPDACFSAWLALSSLIPLIWLPMIEDIDIHMVCLSHCNTYEIKLIVGRSNWKML